MSFPRTREKTPGEVGDGLERHGQKIASFREDEQETFSSSDLEVSDPTIEAKFTVSARSIWLVHRKIPNREISMFGLGYNPL